MHEIIPGDRQVAARCIFERGCLDFGDFTLASGLHSPYYLDLRRLRSFPDDKSQVVLVLADILKSLQRKFDSIADVPTGVTPLVSSLSDRLSIPQITPRIANKTHGIQAAIDGYIEPGEKTVVIDDAITTGGSILRAIEVLEGAGVMVTDVVTVIDREQGGKEALAERGYMLHSAFTLGNLMRFYLEEEWVTYQQFAAFIARP